MDKNKVIEKVRKLLNSNGRSEEEVRQFTVAAQRLMASHGLTEAEFKEEQQQDDRVDKVAFESGTKGVSANILHLGAVLAPHFRVVAIRAKGYKGATLSVIGDPVDVEIFMEVMTYCSSMQEKLFQEYLKGVKAMGRATSRSESIAIKNDYLKGFRRGLDRH